LLDFDIYKHEATQQHKTKHLPIPLHFGIKVH